MESFVQNSQIIAYCDFYNNFKINNNHPLMTMNNPECREIAFIDDSRGCG